MQEFATGDDRISSKHAAPRPLHSPRPFLYEGLELRCDGVSLTGLAEKYGTPLYVYSASHILQRFDLFERWFSYHPCTVCYAVKANSSLAILALLGRQGAGFDIVSGGELERVRRAYPEALSRTVFSGVGKQAWEIDAALKSNILLFNVESAAEIGLLASRADMLGIRARFALRVNPDVFAETHPYISTGLREHKFGIEIGKARDLYRLAATHRSLDPAGVSVHIGSQIRNVEPFASALARVADLLLELMADGHEIRYVDIGGGLGIDYGPEGTVDSSREVEIYAEALRPTLSTIKAHLLLEPGRFIVAQAGGLLSRVIDVKQNGKKTFVVTDAGMNDFIRPSLYQAHHEIIDVIRPAERDALTVDVVGPVCESGDFFARDRRMPRMHAGELALLLDAGAYGMSLASNYNTRGRAAEVLIEEGNVHLIRRRETLDDLLATESLAIG